MSERALISRVRQQRTAFGLSQADLAERIRVSRQALSAIEAGRQMPSTRLALQLARALHCSVDELFRLPGGPVAHAQVVASNAVDQRVVVARIDGELVAHPVTSASEAADGVVAGARGDGDGSAPIELFNEAFEFDQHVLVAGCAPLLGVLAARLGRRYENARATWIPAHSHRSLELLERRQVHVAGVHLAEAADQDAHVRVARRVLVGQDAVVINLARWRQGFVVARGNPLGIAPGPDLFRPGLRWAVRDVGSAAQALLERTLARIDASVPKNRVTPAGTRAADHHEVAQLVRWNVADVGVAIESVALSEGFDFVPLAEERFDLIVPRARLETPSVCRFINLIDSPSFRAEAARLPGYDLSMAGHATSVAAG